MPSRFQSWTNGLLDAQGTFSADRKPQISNNPIERKRVLFYTTVGIWHLN